MLAQECRSAFSHVSAVVVAAVVVVVVAAEVVAG
jgi:hypothetical protein